MRRTTFLLLVGVATMLAGCGTPSRSDVPPPASSTTTSSPTTTTSAATTTTSTTTSVPFAWSATVLGAATRALMDGTSWRPGCPVGLDRLRMVALSYWGFDGTAHTGRLVVNADSVTAVVDAFRSLYQARFPIRQMRPVDEFGGDDEASMAADNTSAFNCRLVPGTTTWSQHAYGRAVDVDPLENPEINDGVVDPPSALPWADRSMAEPGMIRHGDAAWQAFASVGWTWGGDWTSLKDYMHFSANGM